MAGERDGRESFDPRTWGGPVGTARPAPPPAKAKPRPSRPPKPVAPAKKTPASSGASQGPLFIAGGVSLLLLAGGIAVARLYPSVPPRPRTIAPPVEPVDPATAMDARDLVVASPADIGPKLAQAGVVAEVADGIGREAAIALGDKPGTIQLTVELTGPAGTRELRRLKASRADGSGVVLTAQPDGSYRSEAQ